MKNCARIFIVLLLGCLAACQTPHQFAQPTPEWRTFTGQLRYAAAGHSVIGEVVVRLHGDDFQLDFFSGPGFPLMKWRQSESYARAEGILARGSWQGEAANAPALLRGWARLREKLEPAPPTAHSVEAAFPDIGERFSFRFNR